MAWKNKIDADEVQGRLAAWLETRIPDASAVEVQNVKIPTSSGLSCETVLFDAAWEAGEQAEHRKLVARVAPHPDDTSMCSFPTYDLELETSIMRAVAQNSDVPAPDVLFVELDDAVLGGPFLVMERFDGRVPPDDPPFTMGGWVLELEHDTQRRLLDNTLDVVAQIHAVDWEAAGLQGLDRTDRGEAGIEQYISTIEYFYKEAAGGASHPTLEAGIAWAKEHRPTDEGPMVLNWGDARLGNVMFAEDSTVTGVLDWEMACLACREQDLGYLLFSLDLFTTGLGVPWPPGFPSEDEIVARYAKASGHEVQNIAYFKALGGLMAAVIIMRVGYAMIAAELLPADSPMPQTNPASKVTAQYMGLPEPSGEVADWTGVRDL